MSRLVPWQDGEEEAIRETNMLRRSTILALASCVLAVSATEAQQPTYLLLGREPANLHQHGRQLQPPPAEGVLMEPRPYAYGWFGANPRPQWSRHFGYYRNYSEWSAR